MQRRLTQIFTSIKEHGCVGYAKFATMGGFCDLDLVIVKATSPEDLPLEEKYIHELLKIFTVSPSSFRAFSVSFTRRFGKTRCWRVALKCLILLHRLLRSLPENSPLRAEFLWIRTNGFLSLYPCRFHDSSSSSPLDYTNFIRSYAHLLDEAFDFISIDDEENYFDEASLEGKTKRVATLLEILPQLQSMIDRAVECQPTGAAARSFLVQSAMINIIRDSFACYTFFRKDVVVILDNLVQMPYRESVAAFGIYKKAAAQATQLGKFYDWCKSSGLCGSYEYPFVDRIPDIQIQALENFLDGMWQFTDTTTTTTSSSDLSDSSTGDDGGKHTEMTLWAEIEGSSPPREEVEKFVEMEPLIQFDIDDNGNLTEWEALLEASVKPSNAISSNDFFVGSDHDGIGDNRRQLLAANGWQIEIYNPPPCAISTHYRRQDTALQSPVPSNPWGI